MKKTFIFMIFIFIVFYLSAQEWSEPVNISNTTGIDEYPSFCIDNNGVLHCVWAYKIEPNYRKIYYSKSGNDGETWTEPYNISQNCEMWMTRPFIVSDSQNNLYVTYTYNAGNP